MNRDDDDFWDDGTRKSKGNAFTGHGFVRRAPTLPLTDQTHRRSHLPSPRSLKAFGDGGTIPHLNKIHG